MCGSRDFRRRSRVPWDFGTLIDRRGKSRREKTTGIKGAGNDHGKNGSWYAPRDRSASAVDRAVGWDETGEPLVTTGDDAAETPALAVVVDLVWNEAKVTVARSATEAGHRRPRRQFSSWPSWPVRQPQPSHVMRHRPSGGSRRSDRLACRPGRPGSTDDSRCSGV
jgi:hypothetical protein